MKKPKWVIRKEQDKRVHAQERIWLFGIHAVRDALLNPKRVKSRLIVTRNAQSKLSDAIEAAQIAPELVEPRNFTAPIDPGSVHQGAAIEVKPLDWGGIQQINLGQARTPLVLLLDRVSDPHNVGAILRSAEVFGAAAVIATKRHSAPETGALAKAASGALERQPYIRVTNLAAAIQELREMGFYVIGLDGQAEQNIAKICHAQRGHPLALVFGAEGPGLRPKTRENCDVLAKIPNATGFSSLNVSNAAAITIFTASGVDEL